MIQTWVALPEKDEEASPSFNNYTPDKASYIYGQRMFGCDSLQAMHTD